MKAPGGARAWWLAAALALGAEAPLLAAWSMLTGPRALLFMDASSHATIVQALATRGAPHGWIDAYAGGFPLGVHYPAVAWLAAVVLVKAGLSAGQAVQTLGVAATAVLPLVVVAAARRAKLAPGAALAAAAFVAWVSPATHFVTSWESFVYAGLFSQAVATAIGAAWAASLVGERASRLAPLLAALFAAAHPEIAAATALVVGIAGAAALGARALGRLAPSFLAMGTTAVAIFLPGLRETRVPFGWPPMDASKQAGAGVTELRAWIFEGALLDRFRAPVLTVVAALALVVVVAKLRTPRARGALAAVVMALGVAGSGPTLLAKLHAASALVAGVLQPLRVLTVVPFALAALVAVAADEALERLDAWAEARAAGRRVVKLALARLAPAFALLVAALFALPVRAHWLLDELAGVEAEARSERACGDATPEGFDPNAARGWLARLERGRLDVDFVALDAPGPHLGCPQRLGLEQASAVPLAMTAGAGSHVGAMSAAFGALLPTRPGSARRAEALGVRQMLVTKPPAGLDVGRWRVAQRSGDVMLVERVGGTDTVGVGCIRDAVRGPDASLRAGLYDDLLGQARVLARPTHLVAMFDDEGAARNEPPPSDGCDASGAEVVETPREPGAYEAAVDAKAPVDVVVRASAFSTWRVRVDGVDTAWTRVAPGFFAVRVGPGPHRVEAVVSPHPFYGASIALAFAFAVALGVASRRLGRAS